MPHPTESSTDPAVKVTDLTFTYPPNGFDHDAHTALSNISFSLSQSTKLGILGPNGGGKSTLIKLILGILKPTSGSISIFNQSPESARAKGLIGYLPQRIDIDTAWPISIRQTVALPIQSRLKPWQSLTKDHQTSIDHALELVGLSDIADKPIGALSGGQLQRAMIARAIAINPKLLVLDEPTVGVDIANQQRFGELINTLHTQLDLTTIIVSHDMRAIAAVADRIACLSCDLHFHDHPEGLTPAVLAQVFAHDVAPVFGDLHIDAHAAQDCPDPAHQTPCGGCKDTSEPTNTSTRSEDSK